MKTISMRYDTRSSSRILFRPHACSEYASEIHHDHIYTCASVCSQSPRELDCLNLTSYLLLRMNSRTLTLQAIGNVLIG